MKLKSAISLTALLAGLTIQPVVAETRTESVLGTVTHVDVLTSNLIRKTPTDERICRDEEVPVYGEAKGGDDGIGGLIVGGLIGSAIGNKLSDSNGGGAAGAVAGALLGREASKNNAGKGEIVGYRRQEVCEVKRVVLEETIERIDGYRLEIEIDNRIVTLTSKRPYEKGQRVEIAKRTTYSLN
ncbi:MAG: hypothetical protein ACON44_01615 [Candidatus Puniceispirillaceae bacterium]